MPDFSTTDIMKFPFVLLKINKEISNITVNAQIMQHYSSVLLLAFGNKIVLMLYHSPMPLHFSLSDQGGGKEMSTKNFTLTSCFLLQAYRHSLLNDQNIQTQFLSCFSFYFFPLAPSTLVI